MVRASAGHQGHSTEVQAAKEEIAKSAEQQRRCDEHGVAESQS